MSIPELKGKRFAASYSGGKDSALALYRALRAGLIPHALITTYNIEAGRSWFHGLPKHILGRLSQALSIPVRLIKTSGDTYEEHFERMLTELKSEGAEVCVFGDIDIEEHRQWCVQRCENVGIIACFPLWQESRRDLVCEFIDTGFKTLITIVDTARMPERFLGQTLSRDTADEIERCGADICGENGEYHTFTYDGPIFKNPVEYSAQEKLSSGNHCFLKVE